MEKILNYLKYAVATIGTGLTWLLGAWDTAIIVLIAFMVIDYVTGIIKGWYLKELSSDVGLRGIARKFLIVLVLCVAVLLDRLLNTGTWVFRTLACYFYIANEGISILENVIVLGLPVPDQLKNALVQLQDKNRSE
jgi:toxin secretion/phage lysis holin